MRDNYVRHHVMPMRDLVQRCLVCGKTLFDYRGALSPDSQVPLGFAEGEVYVSEGCPTIFESREPERYSDCKP